MAVPSASYSATLRAECPNQAGSLGKIFSTIGEVVHDSGVARSPLWKKISWNPSATILKRLD